MSNPPNDPFNPETWKQQTPPNYNQQVPPNYNQQFPPNYNQQFPPNYNQQVPPGGYQQFPPNGFPPQGNYFGGPIEHPSAASINTTGVLGLIFTFVVAIVGLILNIITISKSGTALREIANSPGKYSEASIRKIKGGRTCSIIGLSIHGFILLIVLVAVIFAISYS
ncbi:MAG: DUF4190 domain-containing protein [Bacteroidetes bacterium]|nr:DUF4190 domain-containing protein [Bacteroidota bacterium]